MKIALYTHVALSLIGILAGLVVAAGLVQAKPRGRWTLVFLATTILTSATGFLLPAKQFLPSHAFAVVSLLVLPVALFARYRKHLAHRWRPTYIVTAMFALYLNVFVLIVQSFLKIPALHALAPNQTEAPFAAAQGVTFVVFVAWTIAAIVRFKLEAHPTAALVIA